MTDPNMAIVYGWAEQLGCPPAIPSSMKEPRNVAKFVDFVDRTVFANSEFWEFNTILERQKFSKIWQKRLKLILVTFIAEQLPIIREFKYKFHVFYAIAFSVLKVNSQSRLVRSLDVISGVAIIVLFIVSVVSYPAMCFYKYTSTSRLNLGREHSRRGNI